MKKFLQTLINLFRKWQRLSPSNHSRTYNLHVCNCYYSEEDCEYIAVLDKVGKHGSIKLLVSEIMANPQLLSRINPVQASSLGWMARESQSKRAANDRQYHNLSKRH